MLSNRNNQINTFDSSQVIKIYDTNRDQTSIRAGHTRLWGLLGMVFGGIEVSFGATCSYGTGGMGAFFGCGAIFAHGLDGIYTGGKQIWYGTHQESLTHQVLKPILGNGGATGVDFGISMLGGSSRVLASQHTVFGCAELAAAQLQYQYYNIGMQLKHIPSEYGKAIFYSSSENKKLAETYAIVTGKYTLEMTDAGKWLSGQRVYAKLPQKYADKLWKKISHRYAESCVGPTCAFIYGAKKERIYFNVEREVLLKNKKVPHIFEFTKSLREYSYSATNTTLLYNEKFVSDFSLSHLEMAENLVKNTKSYFRGKYNEKTVNYMQHKTAAIISGIGTTAIPNTVEKRIEKSPILSPGMNSFFKPAPTIAINDKLATTSLISKKQLLLGDAAKIGNIDGLNIGTAVAPGMKLGITATKPGIHVGVSINEGISLGSLVFSKAIYSVIMGVGLTSTIYLIQRLLRKENQEPQIGGVFDFSTKKYNNNKFRRQFHNEGCTIWFNPHDDGIPGKLGCKSNVSTSTPGITKDEMFINDVEHIFEVRGYADEGVTAYLYVRCGGKNLIWKNNSVKLPVGKPGTVQVRFTPHGNTGVLGRKVIEGDMGVLIDNPKPGQIFRLDRMSVAPVDYTEEYCNECRVVTAIKSPVGGVYPFKTNGLCGFVESSYSNVHINNNGNLVCRATPKAANTTPGIERKINLAPGMNMMQFTIMKRGQGNGKIYAWIEGITEGHAPIEIPRNEFTTIQMTFEAPPPKNGKAYITTRFGLLFTQQSIGEEFIVKGDDFFVASSEYLTSEINGHPVVRIEIPQKNIELTPRRSF